MSDLGVANGSLYAVGRTGDWTFPTTPGAYDRGYSTGTTVASKQADAADAIVLRFDLGLTTLQSGTFLGGKLEDYPTGLAFDGKGNVIVGGNTYGGYASTAVNPDMFPVTAGAFDTTHNGDWDVFVARLDPTLTSLQASTFVGGTDGRGEWTNDVAVAPGASGAYGEGDVFIGGAGHRADPDRGPRVSRDRGVGVPRLGGYYHTNPYIARLDWKLQRLLAATYLQSGGDGEEITGIAVTPTAPRDVFVAGYASRTDFPVSPGRVRHDLRRRQPGRLRGAAACRTRPAWHPRQGPWPQCDRTWRAGHVHRQLRQWARHHREQRGDHGQRAGRHEPGGHRRRRDVLPGGGGCAGEVMWRMASLAPTDTGTLTFTVEVPWGAPDALVEVTARGAASNETKPYFDVAPYVAFVPTAHATSQDISGSAISAQFATHAEAKLLLDYARSIGYKFFDSGSLDTLADGTSGAAAVRVRPGRRAGDAGVLRRQRLHRALPLPHLHADGPVGRVHLGLQHRDPHAVRRVGDHDAALRQPHARPRRRIRDGADRDGRQRLRGVPLPVQLHPQQRAGVCSQQAVDHLRDRQRGQGLRRLRAVHQEPAGEHRSVPQVRVEP